VEADIGKNRWEEGGGASSRIHLRVGTVPPPAAHAHTRAEMYRAPQRDTRVPVVIGVDSIPRHMRHRNGSESRSSRTAPETVTNDAAFSAFLTGATYCPGSGINLLHRVSAETEPTSLFLLCCLLYPERALRSSIVCVIDRKERCLQGPCRNLSSAI